MLLISDKIIWSCRYQITHHLLLAKLIGIFEQVCIDLNVSIPEERTDCQLNQKRWTQKAYRLSVCLEVEAAFTGLLLLVECGALNVTEKNRVVD